VVNKKEWPPDATRLGNRLTVAAPSLRRRGITIARGREGGGTSNGKRSRFFEIAMAPEKEDGAC